MEPDTKDWTWVLERACPDCGYDARVVDRGDLGALIRESSSPWPDVLARPDSAVRPALDVWSSLEYACHVRDVHVLFGERVALMLGEEEPEFANWDQDRTAVESRYAEQDPATVGEEVVAAAESVAHRYDAVAGAEWQRRGRRSNGSIFTVESLGRYHLHDVVHHRWDVGS